MNSEQLQEFIESVITDDLELTPSQRLHLSIRLEGALVIMRQQTIKEIRDEVHTSVIDALEDVFYVKKKTLA